MNVGVLGTGDVGKALGTAFVTLEHDVRMGARAAGNEKAAAWAQAAGTHASTGSFADAAAFGEWVVLATLGMAAPDALRMAGSKSFEGKIVLDTTNPLDFSGGMPPRLAIGHTDSLGEQIQRQIPGARVVKVFNTVGNALMFRPVFPAGTPDMFLCGDDPDAKREVARLLVDFGWGAVDLGGIESSRYLEPMSLVWILHGAHSGSWNHAFKLLRK